jgi:hypothetical protein
MEPTKVEDDEDLYRAIRADSDQYVFRDGQLQFSTTAFNDRGMKPSVDRSSIRTVPREARLNDTDGVTKVLTRDVRKTRDIQVAPNDKFNPAVYEVDAVHRPITSQEDGTKENPAHCQIECAPVISTKTHFRKLKDALARLASLHGFVIKPGAAE